MKLTKDQYKTLQRALHRELTTLNDVRLSKECFNRQELINLVEANIAEVRLILKKVDKEIRLNG